MVNLPPFDMPVRNGERSARTSRNPHNWRNRLSRRDCLSVHTEPRSLLELEELARRTVSLMEKHSPKSEQNFVKAMDLLRQQYNLVICLASLITSQHGSPLQRSDLQDILAFLKGKKIYDGSKEKFQFSSTDTSSADDSVNNSVNGYLKNMEVIDLIEKANKERELTESPKRKIKNAKKHNEQHVYRNYEINRHKDRQTQQLLKELLQDKNRNNYNNNKHQRLTPNNLLVPLTLNDDDRQAQLDDVSLNKYSKVFVILDPLALEKSENKDVVNNLVSKILSLSSSANEKAYPERNKSSRYKGFRVKNHLLSRRYRRDSKETFGRDSLEDDYKPKRSRNDHGGGSGGRTAIPYIRQRGDIYERDH